MKENLSVQELEDRIDEIKKSIPAHSVRAAMLIELEELEEELEQLQEAASGESDAST
jgi:Mg2+ and Co2+ transporter CorA